MAKSKTEISVTENYYRLISVTDVTCEVKVEYSVTLKETKESLTVLSKMQLSSPRDHISVVFSIKLLLKLIWLKVSSAFNLRQRQQWNFPSLSCGA